MTGWRCGWAIGPTAVIARVQRAPEPRDLERLLDHAEGGHGGAERSAGVRHARCWTSTAGAATSCASGSPAEPRHPLRQAGRRVLPVPRRLRVPVARRHPHVGRARAGAAGRGARGASRRAKRSTRPASCASRTRRRWSELRSAAPSGILDFCTRSLREPVERRRGGDRADACSTPALARRARRAHRRRRARPTDDAASRDLRHRRAEARPSRRRRRLSRQHRRGRRDRPRSAPTQRDADRRRAAAAPATPAAPSRRTAAWCSSLERMNRILEIDEANLLAVVEPNVDHRRSAGRGRARRAVLSAGSRVAAAVGRSAATSPSAPAARARSSTARPSATCSGSRPCCRPAKSSRPAARS